MRKRLLIVSADLLFGSRLARFFRNAGYGVELAERPSQAGRIARKVSLALVATAERDSGLNELTEELRAATGRPVVLVAPPGTAQQMQNVVDASDGPALLTRVAEALASNEAERAEPVLRFAGYRLDPDGHTLANQDGHEIKLTRSEFALLREFSSRPGRVLSRDHLLEALSGRRSEACDRSIDMLVGRLRRKIEPDPRHPTLILAVPGHGYKFTPAVRTGEPQADESPARITGSGPTTAQVAVAPPDRRHVVVLSAELLAGVDGRLPTDPEELGTLLSAFHEQATAVIARYGGMVSHCAATEMLVCFGHPLAQENAAERALRAALQLAEIECRQDPPDSDTLSVRVGVAAGLVIVSANGMLIGEAAPRAAFLRGLAGPREVLAAPEAYQLSGGLFNCRPLKPAITPDGLSPAAWQVLGVRGPASHSEALFNANLSGFAGRADELNLLENAWQGAKLGGGQVRAPLRRAGHWQVAPADRV